MYPILNHLGISVSYPTLLKTLNRLSAANNWSDKLKIMIQKGHFNIVGDNMNLVVVSTLTKLSITIEVVLIAAHCHRKSQDPMKVSKIQL